MKWDYGFSWVEWEMIHATILRVPSLLRQMSFFLVKSLSAQNRAKKFEMRDSKKWKVVSCAIINFDVMIDWFQILTKEPSHPLTQFDRMKIQCLLALAFTITNCSIPYTSESKNEKNKQFNRHRHRAINKTVYIRCSHIIVYSFVYFITLVFSSNDRPKRMDSTMELNKLLFLLSQHLTHTHTNKQTRM